MSRLAHAAVATGSRSPKGVSRPSAAGARVGRSVLVYVPEGRAGAATLDVARALAEEKIGFVPGGAFSPNGEVQNTIRLNYSLASEAVIADGVRRLGGLITRQLSA